MQIGGKIFDIGHRTYIMGILNVTPDSFSDGGRFLDMDAALRHAQEMVRDGADILDVGGESTRPGHVQVSEEEEIQRVVPVIRRLKEQFDIPVSIDTYKSKVARAALDAGADLVNDIWGLKYDREMAGVIAEYGVPCCLMHNREKAEYKDFIPEVLDDLRESLRLAEAAGISGDRIWKNLRNESGNAETSAGVESPWISHTAGDFQKVCHRTDPGPSGRPEGRGDSGDDCAGDQKRLFLCESPRCKGECTGGQNDRGNPPGA